MTRFHAFAYFTLTSMLFFTILFMLQSGLSVLQTSSIVSILFYLGHRFIWRNWIFYVADWGIHTVSGARVVFIGLIVLCLVFFPFVNNFERAYIIFHTLVSIAILNVHNRIFND